MLVQYPFLLTRKKCYIIFRTLKVGGDINMDEFKKEEIIELFKAIDSARLMNAPGSRAALIGHGIMLGIREALELKKIKIEGVTGVWYYEKDNEGKSQRQKSASQLIRKEGKTKETEMVAEGNTIGVRWTLEILGLAEEVSKDREEFVKKYRKHQEEMIKSLLN